MGRKSRRDRGHSAVDVDASVLFGDDHCGRRRQTERKDRQLCRQVMEALGEAIASLKDELLSEVWVSSVEPAPDASRLAVLLRSGENVAPEQVKERLAKASGILRSEIACAITRKRVPTLVFELLPEEVTE